MTPSSASAFWFMAMVLQLGTAGLTHAAAPSAFDPDSETTLADSVFAEAPAAPTLNKAVKPEPASKARDMEPELRAPKGSLAINSNPPGAFVFFNSVKQGETPVIVKLTKPINRIVVKMRGYETYDAMIEKNTLRRELTVNLKPEGKAQSPVAHAPPEARPVPESHAESKPAASAAPAPAPVAAKSNLKPVEKATPPPFPSAVEMGTVFFSSSPSHAVITLDGKPTGKETPVKIDLPPGIHHVEMEHDGLKGVADDSVIPGNNKALHLQLQ